jgi:divalent metal cation (Fe/Co/Zn/Cd) transporter
VNDSIPIPSPSEQEDALLSGRMLAFLTAASLIMAALKFHAGWVSESLVLMADAVNMLLVGAAVVCFWSGGGFADGDEEDDRHARARIWTAILLGLMIILCSWEILGIAFENLWFRTPAPAFNWYAVLTAAGTGLIAFGLRRVPGWCEASSGALTFSGWSSVLALAFLVAARLGLPWIDPAGAAVLTLFTFLGIRNLLNDAIFGGGE